MPFALILDILVAVLLVVCISYAWMLNRRLKTLRKDKSELQKLALSFTDATVRAEDSITKLKSMTDMLHDRIDKAESLRDDLVFLIDRGSGAADRLEDMVRSARDDLGIGPEVPGPKPTAATASETGLSASPTPEKEKKKAPLRASPEDGAAGRIESDAERELLKAIRSAG